MKTILRFVRKGLKELLNVHADKYVVDDDNDGD
jgi:hypothetical protein